MSMAALEDLDDRDLLVAAASDADAFGVFYRRHVDRLLRFFFRAVSRSDLALDLTAETFASILVELPRFKPTGAPATAWVYAIARNRLVDSLRRGQVEARARRRLLMEPLELTDEGQAIIERIVARESEQQVLALVEDLPVEQRDAIKARVLDGRDYSEIASELHCSEQVVRKRVSRGIAALRRELGASE
jgi:RNA polymerase sigma-70 factor (ECF subfamily)